MKVLNLVYPEKSDIKYKISKFPDSQQNCTILTTAKYEDKYIIAERPVQIKSRLNNWLDLEFIIASIASLRNLGVKEIHLYIPYFMGARSDRQFEEGGNNYLKQVICPIINSLNLDSVTILDPHSDVLEACLNNFKKEDNSRLVRWALASIQVDKGNLHGTVFTNNSILVSPDAGASHKIYKLAEQIGYKGDIITCSKERDIEGKLTRIVVPINGNQHHKDLIIIDDICDGGRTFINIVEEIRRKQESFKIPPNKIYLIVTHGIFSKGFKELSQYFDSIYTTNSYRDVNITQNINDILGASPKLLKQLNIF